MSTSYSRPFSLEADDDATRLEIMRLKPGQRVELALELQELGQQLTEAIEKAKQCAGRPIDITPRPAGTT